MGRGDLTDEILFGGGVQLARQEEKDKEPAAAGPVITVRQLVEAYRDGRISDEALLTDASPRLRRLGLTVLASSGVLYDPANNNREYESFIAMRTNEDGEPVFCAVTTHGPSGNVRSQGQVIYEGDALVSACNAANRKINEKASKGYVPLNGSSGPDLLNNGAVISGANALLAD